MAALNPDKFYLENVRSLLEISSREAQKICEIAVRQGLFDRGVELLAPDGVVVASAKDESDFPETVTYWEEIAGDHIPATTQARTLKKQQFYRLHEHLSATKAHTHA
ncbi:MAG: hypothetical protein M3O20_05545 [Acidobacteriota bacterium]|nr:hypothetical protein [Acidobacteriota bacterium]